MGVDILHTGGTVTCVGSVGHHAQFPRRGVSLGDVVVLLRDTVEENLYVVFLFLLKSILSVCEQHN